MLFAKTVVERQPNSLEEFQVLVGGNNSNSVADAMEWHKGDPIAVLAFRLPKSHRNTASQRVTQVQHARESLKYSMPKSH